MERLLPAKLCVFFITIVVKHFDGKFLFGVAPEFADVIDALIPACGSKIELFIEQGVNGVGSIGGNEIKIALVVAF
jgi:hypothetical protein